MEKRLTIKEWEESDRPREKFIEKGSDALTNTELLAIAIGSGTKNKNALEIARELLEESGNSLKTLWQSSYEEYMWEHAGIGEAKATLLAAIGELIKRTNCEIDIEHKGIFSAGEAVEIMGPFLKDLKREECWVLFLNSGNKIVGKERITSGGINSTIIDSKLIVKRAMAHLSSGIILFHNHPSGDPTPSKRDILNTGKLQKALSSCDIKLLDHIIIASTSYYSFANVGSL